MSIKDFTEKIKLFFGDIKDRAYSRDKGLKIKDDIYIVIILILVGTASFGLGKLSSYEKSKVPIAVINTKKAVYDEALKIPVSSPTTDQSSENKQVQTSLPAQTGGEVVASKSGTKYYYPWCSGASRIKDENKVWFNSIDEAKAANLTPASNCIGLK